MTTLRYTELYDFVVGILYELKQNRQAGFFSLKKILKDVLQYPSTADDVLQIGKYLEAKGYVKALPTFGDVQIEITPSGIVNWESNSYARGSFESNVDKKNIAKVSKNANSVNETLEARDEIFDSIKKILEVTSGIKIQNPDLHLDAQVLYLEFQKIRPDRDIILSKLLSIDQLPSIRSQILFLKESLNT